MVLKNTLKGLRALSVSRFLPAANVSLQHMQCLLCECIVDRTVDIPSRKLVYAECIHGLVLGADCRQCSVHAATSVTALRQLALPQPQRL